MLRWLGVVLALGLVAAPADAQVFKPKGKKTDVGAKAPAKKAAKTPKAAKKKASSSKKKSAAAERSRPDDLTPDASSKNEDVDYVKITDDEEIE